MPQYSWLSSFFYKITFLIKLPFGFPLHGSASCFFTKYSSSTVEIIPSKGRGLVAGSAVRTVLDLAGVTDVVTKIHTRSKNKLTIARATVEALAKLRAS